MSDRRLIFRDWASARDVAHVYAKAFKRGVEIAARDAGEISASRVVMQGQYARKWLARALPEMNVSEPPGLAEFMVGLLLSGAKREAALGDFDEVFRQDCDRFGGRRARRLYWARAIRSVWPLLRRVAGRLIRWGALAELVRRYF